MIRLLKFLLLVINVVISVALIFSGFGGHVNPATSSIPGIALMIFPGILALEIFLLLFDLLTWRRLAFVPAFTLLICAVPIWNFCPMNISHPKLEDGDRQIKLMTYNVCNMNYRPVQPADSINPNISTLLQSDADIVCLQENRPNDPAGWDNVRSQADSIMQRYPYRANGRMLLSVWSKFPLESIEIPQPEDPTSCLQCVRIHVDENTDITLYNVHLQSLGLSKEDKELYGSITRNPTTHKLEDARYGFMTKLSAAMKKRAVQASLLRACIDSIGGDNTIVAGDFNDIGDCWAQRTIMGRDLHSAFTSVGFGPTLTYYANRFYFNIDHVLYGPEIRALTYERYDSKSSDHYPVSVTFALPTK